FGGEDALVEFGEVLFEALALGSHVDLTLVDNGHIEVRCGASVVAGRRFAPKFDRADTRHAREHVRIRVRQSGDTVRREKLDWCGFLLRHAEVFAQTANGDDEL